MGVKADISSLGIGGKTGTAHITQNGKHTHTFNQYWNNNRMIYQLL